MSGEVASVAILPADDPVRRQDEALPYPGREPTDEGRRLIEGFPSHPVESDHFVFRGLRDRTQPFRTLIAVVGTGDKLVPCGRTGVYPLPAADQLAGNIKTHVAHAVLRGRARLEALPPAPDQVSNLSRVAAGPSAPQVQAKGGFPITGDGVSFRVEIAREAAPLIARLDGRRALGEIAGRDWLAASAARAPAHRALTGCTKLHHSGGARR